MLDFLSNPNEPLDPLRAKRMLASAVALTIAVRLYLLWQYYCISSDGVHYIEAARDFYAGDWWAGLASYYSPGYPLLLAGAYFLSGEWELGGQLFSILCGVVILYPLFLLCRDVYSERIAILVCFLVALSPFLARYSVHVRSESPFFLLSVVALLLFHRGYELKSAGTVFLGGLVVGFAYLVRPEAIGFLIVIPLFVGMRWFLQRERSVLWAIRSCAMSIAGFAVFALPYIVYLSVETGQWGTLSRKAGVTLSVSLSQSGLLGAPELETEAADETSDFVGFIRRHPWVFAKKVLKDVLPAIGTLFEAMHYSYAPFFLAGIALAFSGRFWQRRDFFLLTYVGFFVFGLAIILVRRRYTLQVVPICMGWAALGLAGLSELLKSRLTERRAKYALALTAVLFLAGTLPKTLTPISLEKKYVRDAGLYLKERNGSGNLSVAVFDDRVTFYAGATALMLAGVKEANLAGYLQDQRPQYLAAEAKTWRKMFPHIAARPAQLGLIFEKEFIGSRNDRMLLFRVS